MPCFKLALLSVVIMPCAHCFMERASFVELCVKIGGSTLAKKIPTSTMKECNPAPASRSGHSLVRSCESYPRQCRYPGQ